MRILLAVALIGAGPGTEGEVLRILPRDGGPAPAPRAPAEGIRMSPGTAPPARQGV